MNENSRLTNLLFFIGIACIIVLMIFSLRILHLISLRRLNLRFRLRLIPFCDKLTSYYNRRLRLNIIILIFVNLISVIIQLLVSLIKLLKRINWNLTFSTFLWVYKISIFSFNGCVLYNFIWIDRCSRIFTLVFLFLIHCF